MGKYGLAAILALSYTAGAVMIVRTEGQAHRSALLAERRGSGEPLPPPAPVSAPAPTLVASNSRKSAETVVLPEAKPAPAEKVETKIPETKAEMSENSVRPEPDRAPKAEVKFEEKAIAKDNANANPRANAEAEAFWASPEMSKVWDLKLPTLDDENRFGADLYKAILEMKPESDDNSLLGRVEDAAEPLLKLRARKERSVKFVVLEGNEWNAFSHPGDYIYITTGLLKHFSVNDDETYLLQFVIAHELFHLDNLHALIALNLPDVLARPGGTAAHFLLLVLPFGYPDEPEFAADRWAYQTLLGALHRTPLESREFLMHFENYAKQPRNNFESGRAKPKLEAGRLLLDNHYPAHPRSQKRLRLLKDLAGEVLPPK